MVYYVYMLRCSDKTLYTGQTNDLERRVEEHQKGKGSRYTKRRRPVSLTYWEEHPSRKKAVRREREIKNMRKREKENLVKKHWNS